MPGRVTSCQRRLRAPSGASFVAERPMYFDYYGIDGGSVGSGL